MLTLISLRLTISSIQAGYVPGFIHLFCFIDLRVVLVGSLGAPMRNNTAVQDARLILQLDRLREEAEMRKARRWWIDEFSPRNAADYLKIEMAHGTQQNKWLRQVTTYWGLAASFVLDGTLGEKAFLRPQFSAEMFDMFAKVQPFLRQLRDRTHNPEFMANVEQLILNSKEARDRLREASKRINTRMKVA
jgi:hypothetical protein